MVMIFRELELGLMLLLVLHVQGFICYDMLLLLCDWNCHPSWHSTLWTVGVIFWGSLECATTRLLYVSECATPANPYSINELLPSSDEDIVMIADIDDADSAHSSVSTDIDFTHLTRPIFGHYPNKLGNKPIVLLPYYIPSPLGVPVTNLTTAEIEPKHSLYPHTIPLSATDMALFDVAHMLSSSPPIPATGPLAVHSSLP